MLPEKTRKGYRTAGIIVLAMIISFFLTKFVLQCSWVSSIFLTIGSAVGSSIMPLWCERKTTKRTIIVGCISAVFIFLGILGQAHASHKVGDAVIEETTSGTIESVVPENTDLLEKPASVDRGEIQTAVSFNTPDQIETELQNGESDYVPPLTSEDQQSLLWLQTNFRSEITNQSEYLEKALGFSREYISGLLHTVPNCSSDEMNSSQELATYLQSADSINLEIRMGRTVGQYEALMVEYNAAYEIAKSSTISLQLARPYAEIVEIFPRNTEENCDQIFEYGIQGIHFFLETLTYEKVFNEDDGDILYRIGQVYHYLGDVPHLDNDLRKELYLIAVSYLKLANEYQLGDYRGYTDYYAGMVFHKLGVISDVDNAFYLNQAISSYQQALSTNGKFSTTILADNHKFQGDVYDRLSNYVKMYGRGDSLESSSSYHDLATEQNTISSSLRN